MMPRKLEELLIPESQLLDTVASVNCAVMAVPITKTIARTTIRTTKPLLHYLAYILIALWLLAHLPCFQVTIRESQFALSKRSFQRFCFFRNFLELQGHESKPQGQTSGGLMVLNCSFGFFKFRKTPFQFVRVRL